MKNSILILAAIFFASFFTSCEQDTLMNDMQTLDQTTTAAEKTEPEMNSDAITSIDSITAAALEDGELEERSGRVKIFESTMSLHQGNWGNVYMPKHNMNPNCRYIAVITTYHGDPDLYMKGAEYKLNYSSPNHLRTIRSSTSGHGYNEESFAEYDDLNHYENYLYFSVYGYTNCQFKITIYKECDNHGGGHGDNNGTCNNFDIDFKNLYNGQVFYRGKNLGVWVEPEFSHECRYVDLYVNGHHVRRENHSRYEWGKQYGYNYDHKLNNMQRGFYNIKAVATYGFGNGAAVCTSERTISIEVR